jgi:sensor histidine kinase regulating citrate/malate metabolism
MELTVLEWSFGLGSWIGILCIGMLVTGYEYEIPPFLLSIIPIITITLLYVLIQTALLLSKLILWNLYLMLQREIMGAAFVIFLCTLFIATVRNVRKLIKE